MGIDSEITPRRFGRYVLLDRIGMGGMAEVFRAVMPGAEGFQRTLVIKRILADQARKANFVEMFVQEARIGAMLNHPNIVEVFDFGQIDGGYFLAMEYLRGRDLSAIMKRSRQMGRPLPVPVAAFIAQQVAQGLAYAHGLTTPDGQLRNIVHRDVSPSNVICMRAGGVKLLDFGIAKAFGTTAADEEHSEQSVFKGKLSYLAPERISNDSGEGRVDGRIDLYALGVVLWEMLVGRRLFRGKEEVDTLRNVMTKKVPAPSSLRADVPAALDEIVLRAVQRDPADRYQNGQEMADDLEQVLQEARYQSKMLPQLLRDLFGSDLLSSQVMLSRVTPEMLAECTSNVAPEVPSPPPAIQPPAETVNLVADYDPPEAATEVSRTQLVGRRKARVLVGVGVAALGACVAGVALFGGGHREGTAASLTSRAASPARASVGASGPSPKETSPAMSAAASVSGTHQAAVEPDKSSQARVVVAASKARLAPSSKGRPRRGLERDRIAKGLSIDPFAEAAARGGVP